MKKKELKAEIERLNKILQLSRDGIKTLSSENGELKIDLFKLNKAIDEVVRKLVDHRGVSGVSGLITGDWVMTKNEVKPYGADNKYPDNVIEKSVMK